MFTFVSPYRIQEARSSNDEVVLRRLSCHRVHPRRHRSCRRAGGPPVRGTDVSERFVNNARRVHANAPHNATMQPPKIHWQNAVPIVTLTGIDLAMVLADGYHRARHVCAVLTFPPYFPISSFPCDLMLCLPKPQHKTRAVSAMMPTRSRRETTSPCITPEPLMSRALPVRRGRSSTAPTTEARPSISPSGKCFGD